MKTTCFGNAPLLEEAKKILGLVIKNGAITTDTARDLLSKTGIMKKFHEEKQGK